MQLSFSRIKTYFPNLNETPIKIEDCQKVLTAQNIPLLEVRLKRRGYHLYNFDTKQDFIAVKRGLKELQYIETLFHEIGHVFGLSEFEANAFRLIAIIPQPALMSFDWLHDHPTAYALKLWNERRRVYFLYGI